MIMDIPILDHDILVTVYDSVDVDVKRVISALLLSQNRRASFIVGYRNLESEGKEKNGDSVGFSFLSGSEYTSGLLVTGLFNIFDNFEEGDKLRDAVLESVILNIKPKEREALLKRLNNG